MDAHRGFHHRFLNKRQGFGGVFTNLFPGGGPGGSQSSPAASQTTGGNTGSGGGVIVGGFSSLIGDVPTVVLSSSGPSSAVTPSISSHPASSTGSTTSATPSSTSARPTSSSTSSTVTPTTTHSDTPDPAPTQSSASDIVFTSSEGASVVYITSTLPAASPTATPNAAFLQNPSMEGGVFTIVGLVVLALIFIAVTWIMRKRRRARLERDLAVAVTFDPGATEHYERQDDMLEKRRLSGSSSGHSHGYGYGYGIQPAYAPPKEYYGPMGHGQHPAAYRPPSPRLAPYQTPAPAMPQPAAQGGANLTRKFSDRKPVPPLLPEPAYDPSNAHVSIPPQFYQQ